MCTSDENQPAVDNSEVVIADSIDRLHRPSVVTMLLLCLGGLLAVTWGMMGVEPALNSEIPILTRNPDVHWSQISVPTKKYIPAELAELMQVNNVPFDAAIAPHEVRITNVQVVDIDGDGKQEVLVCDAATNTVIAYHYRGTEKIDIQKQLETNPDALNDVLSNGSVRHKWDQTLIGDKLIAPAHATVVDVDQDGDQDIVVSTLGDLMPSDELVGTVTLFEKVDEGYQRRVLLRDVRRVADVQFGDFDDDGDTDLVVAVFGYARGGVVILENMGDGSYLDKEIITRPGIVHVPVADYDNDGDLDIGAIVTQDEEEVWALENDGQGNFTPRVLFLTDNFDVGGGGLIAADVDQDGQMDLLMSQGDNLEYGHGWPQPYHGVIWLRNQGNWKFEGEQIGHLGGAYGTTAIPMLSLSACQTTMQILEIRALFGWKMTGINLCGNT
jgi:hypothetical protein